MYDTPARKRSLDRLPPRGKQRKGTNRGVLAPGLLPLRSVCRAALAPPRRPHRAFPSAGHTWPCDPFSNREPGNKKQKKKHRVVFAAPSVHDTNRMNHATSTNAAVHPKHTQRHHSSTTIAAVHAERRKLPIKRPDFPHIYFIVAKSVFLWAIDEVAATNERYSP